MYYISNIYAKDQQVNYLKVYDTSFLDIYRVSFDLYNTKTKMEEIGLKYEDLSGKEFGIVQNNIFRTSKVLWDFFSYVDAPKEIACIGEIRRRADIFNMIGVEYRKEYSNSNNLFIDGRHILIVSTHAIIRPVDNNAVFWLYPSTDCNTIDINTPSMNIFHVYRWLVLNFNITDKTEVYLLHSRDRSACHRFYFNKDVIRFITKAVALRRQ